MRRRWLVLGAGAVLVLVAAVSGVVLLNAGRHAQDGKRDLVDAQGAVGRQDLRAARIKLTAAQASFHSARQGIRRLGPLLPVLRVVPLVRVQVRGAETFTKVGENVSAAGLRVVAATDGFLHGEPGTTTASASASSLRPLLAALTDARAQVDGATRDLSHLNGKRLLGPLGAARSDFAKRIPRVQKQLATADDGLRAFIDFAGGSGPRRYLVFSQNPDEVRPTGGFIGTYGVLAATDKGLSLERYASIESWYLAHPDAVVPVADAPAALQFSNPPKPQALVNVNSSPDWPTATRLAMDLWVKGGEQPVDGAVSFTPDFLARLLGVLGPVQAPTYHETVTSQNLLERTEFYVHEHGGGDDFAGNRKQFVAEVAEATLTKLLNAPSDVWQRLVPVVSAGLNAREAMAWTRDASVQQSLAQHGWDGTWRPTAGDFVAETEFEFAAKNGRGLRRTIDHRVEIRPDGSAKVTSVVTLRNPMPADPYRNPSATAFTTLYGPAGAQLLGESTPPNTREAEQAGHPAGGWLVSAPPEGEVSFTAVWDAPHVVTQARDGTRQYVLDVLPLPAHQGDKLSLEVVLPTGWKWTGDGPPKEISLDSASSHRWSLSGD